jgi:hypothetical protein
VKVRFYIDPATDQPHIYGHAVADEEVEDVLARPMEDRAGRDGSRVALGQTEAEEAMKKQNRFPPGWNEARVQRVLDHYDTQSDVEAVAEDEAAYRSTTRTVMKVPVKLVPAVRALLAKRRAS